MLCTYPSWPLIRRCAGQPNGQIRYRNPSCSWNKRVSPTVLKSHLGRHRSSTTTPFQDGLTSFILSMPSRMDILALPHHWARSFTLSVWKTLEYPSHAPLSSKQASFTCERICRSTVSPCFVRVSLTAAQFCPFHQLEVVGQLD